MKVKGTSSVNLPKFNTIAPTGQKIPITPQAAAKNQRMMEQQVKYPDALALRRWIDLMVEQEFHADMNPTTLNATMNIFSLMDALYPHFLAYERHLIIKIAEVQNGDAFFLKHDKLWSKRPEPVRNKFRATLQKSIVAAKAEIEEFRKMIVSHQKTVDNQPEEMVNELINLQNQLGF